MERGVDCKTYGWFWGIEGMSELIRSLKVERQVDRDRRYLWIGFVLGIVSGGCLAAVFLR